MKKIVCVSLLMGLFIVITSVSASAQEDTAAKKYDNPQWKRVVLVDYKPGQTNKAREIINNYHKKASKMAGTPGPEMILELHSGEYDLMAIWAMQGGIEDMNWEISPNNIRWRKAMNELAGGAAEAAAIMQEYSSLVNKSTNYIAKVE